MSLPNTVKRKALLNHDILVLKCSSASEDCSYCSSFSVFLFDIKVKKCSLRPMDLLVFFLRKSIFFFQDPWVISLPCVQAQICWEVYLDTRTVSFISPRPNKNNCYPYVWLQYLQENKRSIHNNDKVLRYSHALKVQMSLLYMHW